MAIKAPTKSSYFSDMDKKKALGSELTNTITSLLILTSNETSLDGDVSDLRLCASYVADKVMTKLSTYPEYIFESGLNIILKAADHEGEFIRKNIEIQGYQYDLTVTIPNDLNESLSKAPDVPMVQSRGLTAALDHKPLGLGELFSFNAITTAFTSLFGSSSSPTTQSTTQTMDTTVPNGKRGRSESPVDEGRRTKRIKPLPNRS